MAVVGQRTSRRRRLWAELCEPRCLLAGSPELVSDIELSSASFTPQRLLVSHERLLFVHLEDERGENGIWTSDGTSGGTHRLWQAPGLTHLEWKAAADGIDYFVAGGVGDVSVIATDGTIAGTHVIWHAEGNLPQVGFWGVPGIFAEAGGAFFPTVNAVGESTLQRWDSASNTVRQISLAAIQDRMPTDRRSPWGMTKFREKYFVVTAAVDTTINAEYRVIQSLNGDLTNPQELSRIGYSRTSQLSPLPNSFEIVKVGSDLIVNTPRQFTPYVTRDGEEFTKLLDGPQLPLYCRVQQLGEVALLVGSPALNAYSPPLLWLPDGSAAGPTSGRPGAQEAIIDGSDAWVTYADYTGYVTGYLSVDATNPLVPNWVSTTAVANSRWSPDQGVVWGDQWLLGSDKSRGLSLSDAEGHELMIWSAEGIKLLADINPGPSSSEPGGFKRWQDRVIFVAEDGAHGRELWTTDGTTAQLLVDLNPGSAWGVRERGPDALVPLGNWLYFVGNNGHSGWELWRTDGSAANTTLVADLNAATLGSLPGVLSSDGESLWWSATTSTTGRELWTTSGTDAGARLVKEIRSGASGAKIGPSITFQGRQYFSADDGTHGVELWTSDGTDAGTRMVTDLAPGKASSYPGRFTVVGDQLFFVAQLAAESWLQTRLFASDGTEAGTFPLWPNGNQTELSSAEFVAWGDRIAFIDRGSDSTTTSIWYSDGTAANSHEVTVEDTWVWASESKNLTPFRDELIFGNALGLSRVREDKKVEQLWRWSDIGTPAGGPSISDSARINWIRTIGNWIFLAVDSAEYGSELVLSDGTKQGTRLIQDLVAGPAGSEPTELIEWNGRPYWVAESSLNHQAIWTLTSEGQVVAVTSEIAVDEGNPISFLTPFADKLYFSVALAAHGAELWRTSGTSAGTELVADLWPGTRGSNPRQLTVINLNLFFIADSPNYGSELWKIEADIQYGDFDRDRDVDSVDLLFFLEHWTGLLSPGEGGATRESGDYDGDRDVDSADLLAFLASWTGALALPAPPSADSIMENRLVMLDESVDDAWADPQDFMVTMRSSTELQTRPRSTRAALRVL